MSALVEPALTAEEWRDGRVGDFTLRDGGLRHELGEYEDDVDRPAAVIALANAARPDDDPGKLTREDLAWVREACDALFAYAALDEAGGGLPAGFPKDAPAAEQVSILQGERLAAKLAALLPPAGT